MTGREKGKEKNRKWLEKGCKRSKEVDEENKTVRENKRIRRKGKTKGAEQMRRLQWWGTTNITYILISALFLH